MEKERLWIREITEKSRVTGCYLVKKKREGVTRNGKPFISMTLADRTGEVEAKVWNRAQELGAIFTQDDILEVSGDAESYQGRIQISVSRLKKVPEGEADLEIFIESAPGNLSEMMTSLKNVLGEVESVHLKALIDSFLGDREFISRFKKAPAAKNFHHSYLGGLLEHTLSVCRMAIKVAEHYLKLDRDLMVTAAFLHDIGKIRELNLERQIAYTDEGRLLGHVVLGSAMLDEKLGELSNFPRDLAIRLRHLILSHHGQYEFGSPKQPKFLEAFALHLIDDLDAKINGLARFMEKDRLDGSWTDFNRMFTRYFLKGEISSEAGESNEAGKKDERQGSLFS